MSSCGTFLHNGLEKRGDVQLFLTDADVCSLVRQGWVSSKEGSELFMNHPNGAEVPIRLERNSSVMDVQIRAITLEKKEEADGKPHDVEARDEASPVLHREEMRVLALQGFVSRELEQLSLSPGWHVLPNGVAAYSDPVALNFMDPRGNFDVEWPARMTLMKIHDGSGHWVQVENTKDFRATNNPYRKLIADNQPQRTPTPVAPAQLQDYFVSGAEVPVSMRPRMGEEIPDWPDSEEEVAEFMGMGAEGEGAPPGGLELEIHEEGGMEVMLHEDTLNMETKLKDLQEWCRKLGLATSGSKTKCLRRLQKFKLLEEQKLAIDLSKRLYEESQREAIPLQVPKLPSRVDQDLHNLTHIPFASCCQCCVAREDERGDKKDRGKSVISFDYGFTYMQGEDEEKQFGACLYMAESETKAVHAVPVLAKGGVSLKQVAEEIVRFSFATSSSNSIILMADGERSTRQILESSPALQSSTWFAYRGEDNRSGSTPEQWTRPRELFNQLGSWPIVFSGFAEAKAGAKIRGGSHVYPWSFRHAAWRRTRFRVIAGRISYEMMFDREYKENVWESVMYKAHHSHPKGRC